MFVFCGESGELNVENLFDVAFFYVMLHIKCGERICLSKVSFMFVFYGESRELTFDVAFSTWCRICVTCGDWISQWSALCLFSMVNLAGWLRKKKMRILLPFLPDAWYSVALFFCVNSRKSVLSSFYIVDWVVCWLLRIFTWCWM